MKQALVLRKCGSGARVGFRNTPNELSDLGII